MTLTARSDRPTITPVTTRRLLPLLLLLAAAPATSGPAMVPFVSDYGFRLKYPAGWIVPPHPDEGQMFTVWLPLDGGPATRPMGDAKLRVGGLGLRIEQGPVHQPDKAVVRDLTGLMAANLFADLTLGAKHVAVLDATVGDLPARQVRFEVPAKADRPAVTVVYVVAAHKGTEYVFNAAVPSAQFEALWPGMAATLASFDVRD